MPRNVHIKLPTNVKISPVQKNPVSVLQESHVPSLSKSSVLTVPVPTTNSNADLQPLATAPACSVQIRVAERKSRIVPKQ